jgi:hypothetical protein
MNPNGLDVSATQIMADIQEKLIEHGLLSEG